MPTQASLAPVMNADEINDYLKVVYPQLNAQFADYVAVDVRPGDTVSGPCLFTLADIGGYICVLSHVGREALAVTTNLDINFMRKAGPGPVDGHCRILKLGRSLLVFDIDIVADGRTVAYATGTYAIPPKPQTVR